MLAVLTGDLVQSTKLEATAYQAIIDAMEAYFQTLHQHHGVDYEIYRGDGFQLVFTQPEAAITVMIQTKLFLNSQVKGYITDCTQCLAYGSGHYSTGKPGRSTGTVFVQSGRGLEKSKPGELRIISHAASLQSATDVICQQMSYIINKLSAKQAELLYHYIKEGFPAHKVLAKWAHTSRQNISERLKAAGGDLLQPFINYTNAQLNQKDKQQL
ncbi:hypothetical protein [Aestuariibacter sp. A3R04]|uniref:hypothetical protein n=1 Tax=Aestuariibacter sp. A3R04 TaxID=2841571 RepID=UPI001C09F3A4|nr:hypothetical protein [Aestuariibacter sp. A3R04]MBU3022916.1 hypothetical protein [Aestuariibacter sp. A3R04]